MNQLWFGVRLPRFSFRCLVVCYLIVAQSAVADVTKWVNIETSSGHIMVDSEIARIPGRALIDTGASANAINERFISSNNLSFPKGERIRVSGVFGTSYRNVYRNVPIKIFGAEVNLRDLVELDAGSAKTQLILGAGFLRLFIFQFDYPNQRMRAITRDSLNLKKLKNVESRKDPQGGAPIVKVRLNDEKDVWLVMDTGNSGGVLVQRELAEKLKWLDLYTAIDGFSTGVNSSGRMQQFKLPTMTFGNYDIADPMVSVPGEGSNIELFATETATGSRIARRRTKSDGLLGYDVLKHFVVTIDYKSGHVHIEPGSNKRASRQ